MLFIPLLENLPANSETPSKNTKTNLTNDFILKDKVIGQRNLHFFKKYYLFPLLGTLGGSLKKMAKKIIPNVPTNKNV